MTRRALLAILALVLAIAVPAMPSVTPLLVPPVIGPILRHFEPPPTPYSAGHRGVDIGARAGATLVASAPGQVTFAGTVAGERYVTIDHGAVRTTCSYVGTLLVAKGQTVLRDQPIATVGGGHPGASQPHVHVSLREGDEYLDPEPSFIEALRLEPWRVTRLIAAA